VCFVIVPPGSLKRTGGKNSRSAAKARARIFHASHATQWNIAMAFEMLFEGARWARPPHSPPSSPAQAGDPVFRDGSD
jgi:hypothetical protein